MNPLREIHRALFWEALYLALRTDMAPTLAPHFTRGLCLTSWQSRCEQVPARLLADGVACRAELATRRGEQMA